MRVTKNVVVRRKGEHKVREYEVRGRLGELSVGERGYLGEMGVRERDHL